MQSNRSNADGLSPKMCCVVPTLPNTQHEQLWAARISISRYVWLTVFCGNKEIRFFPTAETRQHFLTPKPLTVIEGDGYTPNENWISMLHYYMRTAGVISRESLCLLIELAVDEMIARAMYAGSLRNFSSTCHQRYKKRPSPLLQRSMPSTRT